MNLLWLASIARLYHLNKPGKAIQDKISAVSAKEKKFHEEDQRRFLDKYVFEKYSFFEVIRSRVSNAKTGYLVW